MPFQWTINPYRGCEFGCKYCYARYTHEFMELDAAEFEDKIYAKRAARAASAAGIAGDRPRASHIAIGTATDPYQPAERRFGRTRAILEVFAREKGPPWASPPSRTWCCATWICCARWRARNVLGVNLTITTLDENLARLLEPRAPRPRSAPGSRPRG